VAGDRGPVSVGGMKKQEVVPLDAQD
jgi:hypothetical protein